MNASREDPRALIRYALAGAALTVVLGWGLYHVREALLLIYVAALVAIGLSPLVTAMERREDRLTGHRVPRWLAILTIYLLVVTVLVGVAILVAPPLARQARELWAALPEMIHQSQQWLIDRGLLSRELSVREAVEKAPVGSGDAVGQIIRALWRLVGGVFGLVTILILAFYFMVDADSIVETFVGLFPRRSQQRVNEACRRVTTKVSAWLAGQLFLAGVIGTTAAFGLWLIGVPFFYVLALIAALGEMVPIVGPILAAVPAVAVAFTVSPATAVAVAVFFILQQQFENHVLVPKVMERQVGVSAVVVIVALLIGGSLLGIVGAILAVPTAAVFHVIFQELGPGRAATDEV